jgi:NhaA family Na+:H+ antiporter
VVLAFVVPMGRHPETGASPAEALEHLLGGWVAYLVLPLFGFANAGLDLRALPAGVLTDPLVLGIALGLFCGKPLGVFGATWVGLRCGLARLPGVMTLGQLAAVSVLCGIGFTMSLFIGGLAFPHSPALQDEVKIGVLVGSLLSALGGFVVLRFLVPSHRA